VSGIRACVTHLAPLPYATVTKAILVPYSLHTLSSFHKTPTRKLEYLVFVSGSELQAITGFGFGDCPLRSLFFSHLLSVLLIHRPFFFLCQLHSSWSSVFPQALNTNRFSGLAPIYALSIPSSVTQVQNGVLKDCPYLRVVQFEFRSQCWCIPTSAFKDCPLLEPISLPSSVEFIGCQDFKPSLDRFPFLVNGDNFLIADDLLMPTNGREVL
jgi:hypothetical protein